MNKNRKIINMGNPAVELPPDIICSIAQRLQIPDYLHMHAVCTSWRSALKHKPSTFPIPSQHFPWLGLSCLDDKNYSKPCFRAPSADKRLYYKLRLMHPTNVSHWVGSNGGWVVFKKLKYPYDLLILNPISGTEYKLPLLAEISLLFASDVYKVVFNNAIAVVIYGNNRNLAFTRVGIDGDTWKPLPLPVNSYSYIISDVVYHRGKFVVVSSKGSLHTYDLGESNNYYPMTGMIDKPMYNFPTNDYKYHPYRFYLVSTHLEDLLLVLEKYEAPIGDYTFNAKREFTIFKINTNMLGCFKGWVGIKDLGDTSVFLDKFHSFSLSSNEVPGLRRNCIYFAGRYFHPSYEMGQENGMYYTRRRDVIEVGIYDIETGVCEPYEMPKEFGPLYGATEPLWFLPSFV